MKIVSFSHHPKANVSGLWLPGSSRAQTCSKLSEGENYHLFICLYVFHKLYLKKKLPLVSKIKKTRCSCMIVCFFVEAFVIRLCIVV